VVGKGLEAIQEGIDQNKKGVKMPALSASGTNFSQMTRVTSSYPWPGNNMPANTALAWTSSG
jgi:hypothetical protein